MQCLNIKNKEVAALLKKYTKILGNENAAYYVLSENNGYGLDKAPNGEPSKLFSDLVNHFKGNKKEAIRTKSLIYSAQFRQIRNIVLNNDGEVSIDVLLNNSDKINNPSYVPKKIHETYNKLIQALSRRIKDIQYAKYSDSKKVDELRALEFKLNQLENDQATFEFVDYMASDVISALNEVKALQTKVNENQKYNNPLDITSAELDMIKKGYIGFYGNIATNIQNMLDDESTFDYLNDPQLVEDTKQNLKRTVGDYYELVRNYNNLADIVAKDNFIREATKAGSFTIDHLKKILDEGDVDINLWDQWAGNTQYSNSELVRIILNKIVNTKNNVAEKELEVGKELVEILSHVDKSKLAYMHEKNKDGHKTGFITRDLNYGQHYQDYLEHQKKLAEKLGFGDKDIAEVPGLLNPEQLKKWNKANNDWEAKHTIRKFTPEYYELTNSLSEEARSRRDSINMEINLLLSTTVDKNGDYHREDLSDEDYLKLQELETRRRNLANPYYPDGSVKVGLDKEIAIEMREYNEKLREKLHYTPNMEKFNKALQKAKKNLSPEKFAKWEQRNTVDQIIEEFWDDIKTLSSNTNKSDDQILYETARKNMLRLYTREDGKVDVDSMPDQVKSWINTYDELISEESLKTRDKSKKSKVMDIAEWEVNPRFYEELERVEKLGQAEYNAWVSINARYDYEGNLVPASFWKKLVPKKELRSKYMRKVPNRSWSEIDKESPFYDKRFTKYADRGETRIPNPELYDNSANYRKITSDSNLKKLYDKLVDVMELSNSKIQFLKYENKYRLPQIEGGAWTQIRSKDNILKGLAYAIEDTYTVKDDDNAYMLENAKRSDGSLVKLIPTRYIKMLSNPDALTNDIVGSVIAYYKMAENYEQMSEIAPELEVALDFVSRTDFTDKKGGRIQGLESKTYDKLKSVLDQLVYGMEKNALELDVPLPKGKHVTVSVGKLAANLAAYTRIQGIAQNMNVILTGLITNKIQNRLEAISGIYFGNKELAQATKLIIPSYANAIKNIGHSNNKDKVLCYMEYLGVVRENAQTFSKLNQSRFLRALNQHFWYFGHEMSDYVTKGKMALAIGLYYKYDPESGKFLNKNEFLRRFKSKKEGNAKWNTLSVTFYDAFEVKNNKLVIKPEYAKSLDEATINKVRNTAKQVGTRIDTQLTDLDRSKLHATVIGQLLLIFRNFILVNLQTKFLTKRQFNYSTGMWSEAQVPAAVKYVYRHYFNQNKIDQLKELYQNHYDELDDFEKGCLKRVTYEVLFSTVGFMIISSLVRAMADDDKRNWWKQEAAYLTLTVGQAFHDLGFRSAPGIEDVHVHAHALEVIAGQAFQLGGDALAGQVLRALVGGVTGHGQHPAAGAVGRLGVDQIRHVHHLVFMTAFREPVQAGDAHVQDARGDVAADLLHAAQRGRDLGVIDVREIVARMLADLPAGALEKVDGGVFQRALGHAQFEDGLRFFAHRVYSGRRKACCCVVWAMRRMAPSQRRARRPEESIVRSRLLGAVDLPGIEDHGGALAHHAVVPFPVEAGTPSRMAGRAADLLDLEQHGVAVAVQADGKHFLYVPGRAALVPEFLAAAAPVSHFTCFKSGIKCFFIHIRQHQYFVCLIILSYDRYHSITV